VTTGAPVQPDNILRLEIGSGHQLNIITVCGHLNLSLTQPITTGAAPFQFCLFFSDPRFWISKIAHDNCDIKLENFSFFVSQIFES
jgi:hypothetical protein